MELILTAGNRTRNHVALFIALLSLAVVASGQNSPCDLNSDGIVDGADVSLAVDMALGTKACTANLEGAGTCSVLTVQRVTHASRGQGCSVSNPFSITGPLSASGANAMSARVASSLEGAAPALTASGLQFYPVSPCRLVDTRGTAAGFNGIAPFSGPSIAAGATLTIPVQSTAEASDQHHSGAVRHDSFRGPGLLV